MTETAGMRALLALENAAPPALFTKLPGTGLPMWPLARWPVSRALAEADIGTTLPTYRQRGIPERAMLAARRALPNPRSSSRVPQAEHLFVVSGWTKVGGPKGYQNWLSDPFAQPLGANAVVVQDAYLDLLSRDDQHPSNPRTYSYARAGERITRRASRRPLPAHDSAALRDALEEVFSILELPVTSSSRERAITDVLGRADRASHARMEFSSLLDRVRPRRIYMQTAAYGNRAAEISLAHERGIQVAELQHGWMGSSHAAYNVGAAMHEPELSACLPDTLLGYGEFWGEHIRFPGKFIAIGKPTLDRTTLQTPLWDERPKTVLFVSSNFEHDVVDRAISSLRDALPTEWTVVLRPHPAERATAAQRHREVLARAGVELDISPDSAAALAGARAVVGFASTMLFEALAFGCHVAVIESVLAEHYASAEVFPLRISQGMDDLDTLTAAFVKAPSAISDRLADSVWQPNAARNFHRYARS